MAMNGPGFDALRTAVLGHKPARTGYDLAKREQIQFDNFALLEQSIQNDLCSFDTSEVHQGLLSVFAWGMTGGNVSQLRRRLEELRDFHNESKLLMAGLLFRVLRDELFETPYLHMIKGLGIPGFRSGVAYVTKLRMFLDRTRYTVLDSILLEHLRNSPAEGAAARRNILDAVHFDPVTKEETSIAIDDLNEQAYARWCGFCRRTAEVEFAGYDVHQRPVCAADVERGFYELCRTGRGALAKTVLDQYAPL